MYGAIVNGLGMLALSLFFLTPQAQASNRACERLSRTEAVTVDRCPAGAQDDTMILITLHRPSPRPDLTITAVFKEGSATGLWQRFWASPASEPLTPEDQQRLREWRASVSPRSLDYRAERLIDFLVNFVEAPARLENFDSATDGAAIWSERDLTAWWSPICEFIGQSKEARFTIGRDLTMTMILVGERATGCRGRCGFGCTQRGQWRHTQYTQECLDHDACRDTTGQQLGTCRDEFWTAAASYLLAPNYGT